MPRFISPLEFENRLLNENKPVLLVCLRKDEAFETQLEEVEEVEEVCRKMGNDLQAYLLDEDYLSTVWKRYGIKGTPTFMIFCAGKEKAKLLGRATGPVLSRFIHDYFGSQ